MWKTFLQSATCWCGLYGSKADMYVNGWHTLLQKSSIMCIISNTNFIYQNPINGISNITDKVCPLKDFFSYIFSQIRAVYYHSGTLSNNSSFVLLSRLVTNRVLPGIGFFWVGNAMLLRIVVSSLYFANLLPYMIIFQPFAPKLKIKLKPETKNPGFGYLLHPLSRSWNGRVTFWKQKKWRFSPLPLL